jgi:hypothetical protein
MITITDKNGIGVGQIREGAIKGELFLEGHPQWYITIAMDADAVDAEPITPPPTPPPPRSLISYSVLDQLRVGSKIRFGSPSDNIFDQEIDGVIESRHPDTCEFRVKVGRIHFTVHYDQIIKIL